MGQLHSHHSIYYENEKDEEKEECLSDEMETSTKSTEQTQDSLSVSCASMASDQSRPSSNPSSSSSSNSSSGSSTESRHSRRPHDVFETKYRRRRRSASRNRSATPAPSSGGISSAATSYHTSHSSFAADMESVGSFPALAGSILMDLNHVGKNRPHSTQSCPVGESKEGEASSLAPSENPMRSSSAAPVAPRTRRAPRPYHPKVDYTSMVQVIKQDQEALPPPMYETEMKFEQYVLQNSSNSHPVQVRQPGRSLHKHQDPAVQNGPDDTENDVAMSHSDGEGEYLDRVYDLKTWNMYRLITEARERQDTPYIPPSVAAMHAAANHAHHFAGAAHHMLDSTLDHNMMFAIDLE